jgi:hypothetical protein
MQHRSSFVPRGPPGKPPGASGGPEWLKAPSSKPAGGSEWGKGASSTAAGKAEGGTGPGGVPAGMGYAITPVDLSTGAPVGATTLVSGDTAGAIHGVLASMPVLHQVRRWGEGTGRCWAARDLAAVNRL